MTDAFAHPRAETKDAGARRKTSALLRPTQEGIVFATTIVLFVGFSIALDGFLSVGNVLALLRSVSVLGILGLGMAVAVIGRGIDLSMVATMVVSICWALTLTASGLPLEVGLLLGVVFVVLSGVTIGAVVAFAEIPAVFTTLAMGAVIFGFGNVAFFSIELHNAPRDSAWLHALGFGTLLGVPVAIYVFAALAAVLHVILRYTRYGRYIHAMGDNPQAARLSGLPVRPLVVSQYVVSGLVAFLAGIMIMASNTGMNTRLFNTTLVYDVLLVVVLGGIGLGGGRGGVRNVIVGMLLVGTLLSGMTIMNLEYSIQNLVKSVTLLAALIAETLINPRDEQTSQQGDI